MQIDSLVLCSWQRGLATPFGALMALALCAPLLVGSGCSSSGSVPAYGGGEAQLFGGLGKYSRNISTPSPEAQQYFDQGLAWTHAFNFDEAVRSFTKVTELDPNCAMGWWGVALAQGPNYNNTTMGPPRSTEAWEALQEALDRRENATPVERALIEALAARYAEQEPQDRASLDEAYADAMQEVWSQFPKDPDVGTFFAESLMLLHPWELYDRDGAPAREDTHRVIAALERVLEIDPNHPGANHLYIHAVEPSRDKVRAIAAADRLCDLMPASGHMLHMPSHIYVQVGRWQDSIDQNASAIEADDAYREQVGTTFEQFGYALHNEHMLVFSAMMIGQEQEATKVARQISGRFPWLARFFASNFVDVSAYPVYDVMKRFGRWDEILEDPGPPGGFRLSTATWRAHRAIAFAAKQDFESAAYEQQEFRAAAKRVTHEAGFPDYNVVLKFLLVCELFVEGEIALHKGKFDQAIQHLRDAVEAEDMLGYREPPLWMQPTRHALGAVLLKAERFAEAEQVYREDLRRWPDNGWSLFGLSRALEEQQRQREAQQVRAKFEQVWADADAPITTSCMCVPQL